LVNGTGGGGGTGAGDDGSTSEINPPQEDQDVILTGTTATNGNDAARISLNNTGTERVVTSFRVSFYYPDQGGNGAETASFNGSPAQNVGADQYTLGPDRVTLPSDATTDITIDFAANKNLDTRGDFFILTVQFDDGEFATYFVAVP
ncbi:hypothetical protein DVK07_21450, partial [Halorubrum sp. Atlit-26R]